MAAAKQLKFNYLTEALVENDRKTSFSKTNFTSRSRTARGTKRGTNRKEEAVLNLPALSISGVILPTEVVRALTNYVPTKFRPKSKDDLLAMMVNVE